MAKKKPKLKITEEEWVSELAGLHPAIKTAGYTMQEICAKLRLCRSATHRRVQKAIAAGLWRRIDTKTIQDSNGKWIEVPAYEPVKQTKKG